MRTLELASSHLVCSVALTGVLALQAARWWAELSDDDDAEEVQQALQPPEKPSVASPEPTTTTSAQRKDKAEHEANPKR